MLVREEELKHLGQERAHRLGACFLWVGLSYSEGCSSTWWRLATGRCEQKRC